MADTALDRLEGLSSTAILDEVAKTLTFVHHGSIASDDQKALSPLAVPLSEIAAVEITCGRSTNWFWVQRRGQKPWKRGVSTDPCGVVSRVDPTDFAERVRLAVARVAPTTAEALPKPASGWRKKLAKGVGRSMVDGFFNTR